MDNFLIYKGHEGEVLIYSERPGVINVLPDVLNFRLLKIVGQRLKTTLRSSMGARTDPNSAKVIEYDFFQSR